MEKWKDRSRVNARQMTDSDNPDAPQTMVQNRERRQVILAAPRGFCAGVERAIHIVEAALQKFGAPVYVRHEIVHNAHVVNGLREKGAVFVDELAEIPDNDRPVIFSAHGVPKSVPEEAQRRRLFYIDATCPLVSKVHNEVIRGHRNGRHIFLIGHKGHPEVIGSLGQVTAGAVTLIETVEDARSVIPPENQTLSFVTQTTLSVDDTALIIDVLKARFPGIISPAKEDICYATTNRQNAVKAVAAEADLVLVVGAANSSNSLRLVESARRAGSAHSVLIRNADDIPWQEVEKAGTIGISAGASAPEDLVEQVLQSLGTRYRLDIRTLDLVKEDVVFKIPALLAETPEQSTLS